MTTLAFWHGWGISPDVFTPFITELKKNVPDNIHFQAMPLPGYDGTPLPEGNPCEVWVDAMMKNIPGPVVLCGWSMGAILAMSAALRYPDLVDKLILFGATPCFVEKPDWENAVSFLTGHQFRTDVGKRYASHIAAFRFTVQPSGQECPKYRQTTIGSCQYRHYPYWKLASIIWQKWICVHRLPKFIRKPC